ncbi:MAG: response regulator transcription factor [Defluviitaleaceae bacterium]|nr:response regulator transcription factor [Defluviitaleaceae bacterium]
MANQNYILMIEDEPKVQINNKKILQRRGFETKQAYTIEEAKRLIAQDPPRAIVLDIQLPDGNGLKFLHELRQTSNIPVLILTAMGTRDDILAGLKAGGDDYLPKPYDVSVLTARLETLLHRASIVPDAVTVGPFSIDPLGGKAYIGGKDMQLAGKEIAMLTMFAQFPEKILTACFIYGKVWGQEMHGDDNALKTVVSRLRKKIAGSGYTISSIRNEGYIFERE